MTVPSDAAIGERGARRRAREPATRRGLRERTPRLRRLRRSRAQSPRRREANRSPRESSNAHPTLSTRRGRRNTSTIQYIVLTLVFVYDATGHPARGNPAYTFDWRDSVAEFRSFGWEGYLYYDILPPPTPPASAEVGAPLTRAVDALRSCRRRVALEPLFSALLSFPGLPARLRDGRLPSRARREAVSSFPSVRAVPVHRADDRDVSRRRLRAPRAPRHAPSGSRREGDAGPRGGR